MRDCRKNQRSMKYSLYSDSVPILDSDGNDTFEVKAGFSLPVDFKASLSSGKSDSESTEFGTDVSYDRIISTCKKELPIDENSLIWVTSEPVIVNGVVDPTSADYRVASKPIDGLTNIRIAIKAIQKSYVETSAPNEETGENEPNTGSEDDGF